MHMMILLFLLQPQQQTQLRGKVLRVRKCPRELLLISQSSPNSHKTYEEELNSTYSRLKGVSSREEYLKIYVKDVIGKLLDVCHEKGQELVDPGVCHNLLFLSSS